MPPRMIAVMVLLGGLAATTPARAVLISGFGTPVSDPALAGGTVITFDATTAGAYGSLAIGNATFIGVDAPFNIGADFNGSFNTSGGQSLFNGTDFVPAQFRVDFATPVDAFAFNWGAADNQWLLSAFDSASNLIEANLIPAVFNSNAGDYFGVAATDIAFLTLVDQKNNAVNGDFVFIDSFTYRIGEDGPVPIPEPPTLGLFAAGLATFALLSRRRKVGQFCRFEDNG